MQIRKIYLASSSPTRAFLMKKAGLKFSVVSPTFEEDMSKKLKPKEMVLNFAKNKVLSILPKLKLKSGIVLSADTVISFENKILGKPGTEKKAAEFLKILSNKKHLTITGVYIYDLDRKISVHKAYETKVKFRKLRGTEIDSYSKTKESQQSAGGYRYISLGSFLMKGIEGDGNNISGLPISELIEIFYKLKVLK